VNGDYVDFDPELTFSAAVQDFQNGISERTLNPQEAIAVAQVQALLVIAHQLGAIARYYETAEAMLKPPFVHTDDVSQDGHKPGVDVRNLVAEGAEVLARWARQL
jgi:hypothetical protein